MKENDLPDFPEGFQYQEIFLLGRPRHPENDVFRYRHPVMEAGHRAKIFSPFDALKGFDEAIRAQEDRFLDPLPPDEEDEIP